ncbi:MAG: cell division protein ZapD [Shewanella sp.]|nr:cell division protein ZapD [Shewanella sp.]MCF1431717.1 cell division protein ZapD [Shewanella sp.]MCF1439187.1 cell division protein ZapD [Shewanella sp.]MCF1457241.1 cell division protein ZapD [Shewanella sp.]
MTDIIYEQPLNEKIRSYLRLEYLSDQLILNQSNDYQHSCFYPLFALCELNERCDYRGDVIKDIDRQLQLLQVWQSSPQANSEQIQGMIDSMILIRENLNAQGRTGVELKQDRFLQALRQRFSMPGACCNFDLPQLHYWLAQPFALRCQDYERWTQPFQPLLSAISLLLQLTRNTAEFTPMQSTVGFFQGVSDIPLSLIRVKVEPELECYPTISGHRNRYAIHFVDFETQKHSDKSVSFQLAACR